jgi:hypothetical protein
MRIGQVQDDRGGLVERLAVDRPARQRPHRADRSSEASITWT